MDDDDKLKQPAKKQKTKLKQQTLFEIKAVKKVSHDKRGNRVESDFKKEEVNPITGTVFGKGVTFQCGGCGKDFRNQQGLSGHQIQ